MPAFRIVGASGKSLLAITDMMQHIILLMIRRGVIEPGVGRGRRLRLLLAVLLGIQALIAGSHFHSCAYPADRGNCEISSRPSGDPQSRSDPADCPTCRLVSMMGEALLPSAIGLFLSGVVISWAAGAAFPPQACPARPQGWQSRAPPAAS